MHANSATCVKRCRQDCGSSRHRMSGVCAFRGQNFASSCPEVVRPGGSGDPSHVRICASESQKLLLLHAWILKRRHHEQSPPGWEGHNTHGRGFRHNIWSKMAHQSPKICQMGVELGKTLAASAISPKPSQSVEFRKKTCTTRKNFAAYGGAARANWSQPCPDSAPRRPKSMRSESATKVTVPGHAMAGVSAVLV